MLTATNIICDGLKDDVRDSEFYRVGIIKSKEK